MHVRSSKFTTLFGFSAVLILLILLMGLSLWSISENTSRIDKIVSEQGEVKDVFTMRDAAQRRSLMLYRMITIEDEFDREDIHMDFKEQAGIFIGARDKLFGKTLKYEDKIWNSVKNNVAKGSRVQGEAINLVLRGQREEAANKVINEVIPTQDIVMSAMTNMLTVMNKVIYEELELAKQQNNQAYIITIILGVIALVIGISVTSYVVLHNAKTENLLKKQQVLAQEASIAKTSFLANMSHEIRTPLAAIIGFSENLLIDNFNIDNREKLGTSIVRNSKHLLQLINDILDISKIEAGELDIENIDVSPTDIVAEVDSIIGMQARSKGLSFNMEYQFPIPRVISSDPTRLKQILINLCGNAIKFTEQGNVTINMSYQPNDATITFVVSDTGIGMEQSDCQRIFNPFSQADTSTTRKHGGTGLGLSISKQLAEKMAGSLDCNSVKGKGSVFKVVISTGKVDESKMLNSIEENVHHLENIDVSIKPLRGNILLAEDSVDNQELISMFINRTGAKIKVVNNGEQAVEEGMVNDYDLILMDMQMPVMDGIEAINLLRASGYEKPIITLTANVMKEDRQLCEDAGADGFLSKPIDVDKFYAALNKYLEVDDGKNQSVDKFGFDDDPEYQALVQKFVEGLPSTLNEVLDASKKSDFKTLESLTHKLRGMGGAFGFPEITEKAAIVNDQCIKKDFNNIATQIDELVLCLTAINKKIAV